MLRFLLLFIFLYLFLYLFLQLANIYIAWRKRQQSLDSQRRDGEPEEMVLDPQCQSYLPKGSAILRSGHYFCSEECARRFLSRP